VAVNETSLYEPLSTASVMGSATRIMYENPVLVMLPRRQFVLSGIPCACFERCNPRSFCTHGKQGSESRNVLAPHLLTSSWSEGWKEKEALEQVVSRTRYAR